MTNPYHNSKIYKLVNPHTDKIYIGSTIQKLSSRKATHTRDYKNWKSGKDRKHASSCFIFEASEDIHETKIELIKEVKCENKKELWNIEMEIINQHDNCVNENKGQTLDPNYRYNTYLKHKDRYNKNRRIKRQENIEEYRKKDQERYKRDKQNILERHKNYRKRIKLNTQNNVNK